MEKEVKLYKEEKIEEGLSKEELEKKRIKKEKKRFRVCQEVSDEYIGRLTDVEALKVKAKQLFSLGETQLEGGQEDLGNLNIGRAKFFQRKVVKRGKELLKKKDKLDKLECKI